MHQPRSLDEDRHTLEMGEARTLVYGFLQYEESQEWLERALRVTERRYGRGSVARVKAYMRVIWREELLK